VSPKEGPGTVYTFAIAGKAPLPDFTKYQIGNLLTGVKYDPTAGTAIYVEACAVVVEGALRANAKRKYRSSRSPSGVRLVSTNRAKTYRTWPRSDSEKPSRKLPNALLSDHLSRE
jgi:hypothetical protein